MEGRRSYGSAFFFSRNKPRPEGAFLTMMPSDINDPSAPRREPCRGFGKIPLTGQDFLPRGRHPRRIVPSRCYRNAVDTPVVAIAEVQRKGAVRVCLGGNAVVAVNIPVIGFEVTFGVLDRNGPEGIHRHVPDIQGSVVRTCRSSLFSCFSPFPFSLSTYRSQA